MKRNAVILSVVFVLAALTSLATVHTVSNHPLGGAQYSNLQAAYDAATIGDTLILEGTDINYYLSPSCTWDKSLTVIGAGFNPQKQNPKRTYLINNPASCCGWNYFCFGAGGSGSGFYGIISLLSD